LLAALSHFLNSQGVVTQQFCKRQLRLSCCTSDAVGHLVEQFVAQVMVVREEVMILLQPGAEATEFSIWNDACACLSPIRRAWCRPTQQLRRRSWRSAPPPAAAAAAAVAAAAAAPQTATCGRGWTRRGRTRCSRRRGWARAR
jgi:hypothetical protein